MKDYTRGLIEQWVEEEMGVSVGAVKGQSIPVLPWPTAVEGRPPLRAVKLGERAVVMARQDWVAKLAPVVATLPPDMLFSPFGAYELARVTLPDGHGVWGPSWYLFGDETTVQPASLLLAVPLTPSELDDVDYDVFWHCARDNALAGFGVRDGTELVALATVKDHGGSVWEIGMDVAPDAKRRGLGRAVVSAAAHWVVEKGNIPLATVGPFNVPSARTLRAVGLEYVMQDMVTTPAPFKVPPQPLGRPLPDAEVHDYYPRWAMNQDIKERP